MKKFVFSLQAVLTLRQRAEQTALKSYGEASLARQDAIARLQQSDQRLAQTRREWLEAMAVGCNAAQTAQMHLYSQTLREEKTRCEQALERAEVELNRAQQKAMGARQRREAVETIYRDRRTQHSLAAQKEEQKLIEDLLQSREASPRALDFSLPTVWN